MKCAVNRKIPIGQVILFEGLALGIEEIILSFYQCKPCQLVSRNIGYGRDGLLSIYHFWFKHATAQNFVIRGGAGTIPPLVGW